jgi:hypothetical protein
MAAEKRRLGYGSNFFSDDGVPELKNPVQLKFGLPFFIFKNS